MRYYATRDGRIFNSNDRELNPYRHTNGYRQFKTFENGGVTTPYYVHRFVWEYFNGEIPQGLEINHINEDKSDNRLENLELVTKKQNIRKRSYNKLSMDACKAIREKYIDRSGYTLEKLAKEYDCHPTTIRNCIIGESWS